MDHNTQDNQDDSPLESEADRLARIARERIMIEQGERDVRAGRVLEWSIVKAWLERLDDDPNAPPPAFPHHEAIGI